MLWSKQHYVRAILRFAHYWTRRPIGWVSYGKPPPRMCYATEQPPDLNRRFVPLLASQVAVIPARSESEHHV